MMVMADKMTAQDHVVAVGSIITNLQGLETVIRIFLARTKDQKWRFPSSSDEFVDENYVTNFRSLGSLIDEYNGLLSNDEQEFKVDRSVVDIRDAFAHGRLLSVGNVYPATLYKFGVSRNGRVPIVFQEVLTVEWLNRKKLMVRDEQMKVVNCHKKHGYKGSERTPSPTGNPRTESLNDRLWCRRPSENGLQLLHVSGKTLDQVSGISSLSCIEQVEIAIQLMLQLPPASAKSQN